MKNVIAAAGMVAVLSALSGPAAAKGCLTGAAVGGVAGHVAGHHGVLGAAAGCAINHHRNKVKDRNAAAAATRPVQPAVPGTPAQPTAVRP